ncbi:AIPR family protein [Mucilaginibacter aquatilis]|uniref:Abortive phage resistance protein n=1 Tax=Mucilaginibacter aquatilis TaxID=1517760 RepID=A0A6I4IQN4_9SPHI|nr:AIPR family protein [Mucilaginibacter aquatilis]MVN91454.1 abortive phage resistance protein [Mucilaginibacter aquatilis]
MSNLYESAGINRFYSEVSREVRSTQLTGENGGTLEQTFTQWALNLLGESGEIENARPSYDEKALGTKNQHKINGYAISENYETVDLIITLYRGYDEPQKIAREDVDTAVKRITNFFRKAVYKDYAGEIEEASEIFQFAHTLSTSSDLRENLVRINAIIITDGIYSGKPPAQANISGYPVFVRIVDLEYLYNISVKSHIPIEINFREDGFEIPCVAAPGPATEYQSYLAIVPGNALAVIYERFGARLLEQNVRSFLQFSGKINNGIRKTIMTEPQMFLAFNNGIAATAEDVTIAASADGKGQVIASVKDLQIVNGGQTTASIYHTLKKDKADISGIYVQLKLSLVTNKDNLGSIVSRIAEYANTQNKVSVSDLSSNKPFHVELEKISRALFTPHHDSRSVQTRWFYERVRGQYKNARLKDGFTDARARAFDIKNPKFQVFSKEDIAKYENAYGEKYTGRTLAAGPWTVVRGNQKNYVQFMAVATAVPDNIFFEDLVAKAIIFRAAEKIYGTKPNAIGDMRYITVPYAIGWLAHKTNYQLDLFKIWKEQQISENLSETLYDLMSNIDSWIRVNAPGSLYGEWAKKEDCWNQLKNIDFKIDLSSLKGDFADKRSGQRKKISEDEAAQILIAEDTERLRSVPPAIWRKIDDWGKATGNLSLQQQDHCFNLVGRIRNNKLLTDTERLAGIRILEIVTERAPEILYTDDPDEAAGKSSEEDINVTLELLGKVLAWDRRAKKLQGYEYQFMNDLVTEKKSLTDHNKRIALLNIKKAIRCGFTL